MSDRIEVHVNVRQIGPTASEGAAREHTVVMDRPEAKGGENRGAMGGEHLLMALGGCFMSNLLAAAQSRDTSLADVRLAISGTLDTAPPRFVSVTMQIKAGQVDPADLEKLVTIAERGCIVAHTLKNAVDLEISL